MTQEALKLALEALEQLDGIDTETECVTIDVGDVIDAIKEALAQPEQEPVEWGVDWGKDGNSVSIIKRLADGNIEVLAWEYEPHPQQRTERPVDCERCNRLEEQAYDLVGKLRVANIKLSMQPQRKPLPPQSPCEMTQAEGKMFKLGWLECEAAHGIKE